MPVVDVLPGNFQFVEDNKVFAGSTSDITSEKTKKVFAVFFVVVCTDAIPKFNSVVSYPTAAILDAVLNPEPPSSIATLVIVPLNVLEIIAVAGVVDTSDATITGSPTL